MCNVGYRISAPTTEKNGSRKPYSVWKNMLYRCYSKKDVAYDKYGGAGVKVSDEWHCFDTFRKDIENLPGFNEELFYKNKLQLDKDGLSGLNKIYSKETCQWLSREENLSLAEFKKYLPHLTKTRLVALSPQGEIYCIINVPIFADEIGIDKSEIYGTLSGLGNKTCRGWCFKKVVNYNILTDISREEFTQKRHGVVPLKYEIVKNGKVIQTLNNVHEAAEYMKCSVSNINQRTRNGQHYHKYGVELRRKAHKDT